jgi:hypothetical protein
MDQFNQAPAPTQDDFDAFEEDVSDKRTWKFLKKVQGTTVVNLPVAKEYYFIATYGTASAEQALSFQFHGVASNDTIKTFTSGYYLSNGSGTGQVAYYAAGRTANLTLLNINGTDYTSTSYLTVYYR